MRSRSSKKRVRFFAYWAHTRKQSASNLHFIVNPAAVTDATVAVPGDKSVSHRALLLGSVAEGRTEISGFLAGEDCLATLAAMSAMGTRIERSSDTDVVIHGVGLHGLGKPDGPLDLGNSGTAMRLMTGLLCGQKFDSVLTGDASLANRPMQRVILPLAEMGATIDSQDGRPPLTVRGGSTLVVLIGSSGNTSFLPHSCQPVNSIAGSLGTVNNVSVKTHAHRLCSLTSTTLVLPLDR